MLHARVVGARVGAQIRYAFFLTNSFTFTQKYPAQTLSAVIGTDGHTVQDSARLLGTPLSFDGVVGGFSAEINANVACNATGFVPEYITSAQNLVYAEKRGLVQLSHNRRQPRSNEPGIKQT